MRKILVFAAVAVILSAVSCGKPQAVIFDTDMGNDIDDALALAMLCRYADEGKAELLGVMINKNDSASAEFVDIVDTYYGHGDIPMGIAEKPVDTSKDGLNPDGVNYVTAVSKMDFTRTQIEGVAMPSAVKLYRKLLASRPNRSVRIISVGFLTNLAALLESPADDISPMTGKELVAKKVDCVAVMAGNFRKENDGKFPEYNVVRDIPSAQKFFAECPVSVVVSPFELGDELHFPAEEVEKNFGYVGENPVVEAYKVYRPMPYDRPMWDLTAVLYGVENNRYFRQSGFGTVEINDQGFSTFHSHPSGKHIVLAVEKSRHKEVIDHCVSLIQKK